MNIITTGDYCRIFGDDVKVDRELEWQFYKKNVSEKRLLELCRLFLRGGLAAVENEEPWKQVRMKGSY